MEGHADLRTSESKGTAYSRTLSCRQAWGAGFCFGVWHHESGRDWLQRASLSLRGLDFLLRQWEAMREFMQQHSDQICVLESQLTFAFPLTSAACWSTGT